MSDHVYEWDLEKARQNIIKHDVSFEDAKSVFHDRLALIVLDDRFPQEEERWFIIGLSKANELLVLWYTERAERVRIIGARRATRSERRSYEDERIF